jgi:hypothetical protein
VAVPVAKGIAGEQGMADDAPNPAPAFDAVLRAPCVEALGASPGNCTAACGLTDADALMPDAVPADPDVVVEPAAGAAVNDADAFDEAAFDEVTPDGPASQPNAIERLPMNEPPTVEQGVPGRLAPFTVVVSPVEEEPGLAFVPAADALVPDIFPFGTVPCGTT